MPSSLSLTIAVLVVVSLFLFSLMFLLARSRRPTEEEIKTGGINRPK